MVSAEFNPRPLPDYCESPKCNSVVLSQPFQQKNMQGGREAVRVWKLQQRLRAPALVASTASNSTDVEIVSVENLKTIQDATTSRDDKGWEEDIGIVGSVNEKPIGIANTAEIDDFNQKHFHMPNQTTDKEVTISRYRDPISEYGSAGGVDILLDSTENPSGIPLNPAEPDMATNDDGPTGGAERMCAGEWSKEDFSGEAGGPISAAARAGCRIVVEGGAAFSAALSSESTAVAKATQQFLGRRRPVHRGPGGKGAMCWGRSTEFSGMKPARPLSVADSPHRLEPVVAGAGLLSGLATKNAQAIAGAGRTTVIRSIGAGGHNRGEDGKKGTD